MARRAPRASRARLACAALACSSLTLAAGCAANGDARVAADTPAAQAVPDMALGDAQARCAALGQGLGTASPVPGLVVTQSAWVPAGLTLKTREGETAPLPAHCLVEGHFAEHEGRIGGPYAIGFRMRLPGQWNQRFLFQGGGGSNGVVGDATGPNGAGNPLALVRGYAVIAQDSGHDNTANTLPSHQGELVFGFAPEARRNYGHASLPQTNALAHALLAAFYGHDSSTNLYWGCSKGGQEGMAFAQRYPEAFDGIVAMAPGMSLPRAALAQAWDVQQVASVLKARGEPVTLEGFKTAFRPEQLQLVAQTALALCDRDDGLADGVIGAVGQCTSARVVPELRKHQCGPGAAGTCLEDAQITALTRMIDGPRDHAGKALYAPFPWDTGIAAPGWAMWKVGLVNGPPAFNVLLGGGSLAAVFTSPPTALGADPASLIKWQLGFDFDTDAKRIYAKVPPFTSSPWEDVGMRASDLSKFRAHGGKLIVPHGASDPVFSVLDTIAWWREVDAASKGQAASFARVFAVPGMNHCGGGPATSRFDSLGALENWVLAGKAPDAIPAEAGDDSSLAGRRMPLCAFPTIAVGRKVDGVVRYTCAPPPRQE